MLLIMSAPSGAGKTSIGRQILEMFPQPVFSVSSTTRAPGPARWTGGTTSSSPRRRFAAGYASGDFLEWVENYGNLYGTSRTQVEGCLARGEDLLLDIEPRAPKAVRRHYPGAVGIFVLPPSLAELRARLEKAGGEPCGDGAAPRDLSG
jgi:guanylate kinase